MNPSSQSSPLAGLKPARVFVTIAYALAPLSIIAAIGTLMLPAHRSSTDAQLIPQSYPQHELVAGDPTADSQADPTAPNQTLAQDDPHQTQDQGIQECVITLISGRKITGELIRQDSLIVVVGINGIETTFQRTRIASVSILPPIEQRYRDLRSAIEDHDIESRLTLVEWLRARRAYTLARNELESILQLEPQNPRAKLLYNWLTEHDKLNTSPPKQRPNAQESDPATPSQSSTDQSDESTTVANTTAIIPLTPEQINLIRVFEIDLRNPPKIRVPEETLRTLMLRKPDAFSPNKDERDTIFKLPEIDKLKLLFTHKARDLYSQVVVLEDPAAIKNFKVDVHAQRGWLINACASTRCHGGTEAGRFQLLNTRANSDQTAYTNLYIIEQFKLADGSPLINFEAPQSSPLLQMAMVQKNSLYPHPPIPQGRPGPGFRPIFRSTRDRKYQDAIEWIRSMYQPRPNYGFDNQTQSNPEPDSSTLPAP